VADSLRFMLNARLAKVNERGASAPEYGLLIVGIVATVVATVFILAAIQNGGID
jgi:pilus assembly protein Flp/PilA